MQQAWTITRQMQCAQETHCRGKKTQERIEKIAVAHEVMIEIWKFDTEDYVIVCEDEVSVDVQRHETHSCTDCGASRFGLVNQPAVVRLVTSYMGSTISALPVTTTDDNPCTPLREPFTFSYCG